MRETDNLRESVSDAWVDGREIPRKERVMVPLFSAVLVVGLAAAAWFWKSGALGLAASFAAMTLLPYAVTAIRYAGRSLWRIEISPSKLRYSRVGEKDLEIQRSDVIGVRAGGPEPGIGVNNIWLVLKDGRQQPILGMDREPFARALEAFRTMWGVQVTRYSG